MRDVPPPARPWVGRMRWTHLAFLHWPVTVEAVRDLVPPELQVDTFADSAWVGVVPFRMEGVRLRAAPPVPTTHVFPEINVRTYVRAAGRAGVWFFSLDAASRLAVRGARLLLDLPYFDADIEVAHPDGVVDYHSVRTHRQSPSAEFKARYGPTGDPYEAAPDTLDHFLVERYCLFTHDRRRGLGLLDIDHPPWPLQPASAEVAVNTMALAAGIELPRTPPLVHYAEVLDVRAWTRQSVS